ncbi:TSUP family transporter [Sinomicrobium weinanense]
MLRHLPLFIILSLVAEVLGTVGESGSSVFFVPIANYFPDFQSVLGVTALFHLVSNVIKTAFFRKGIDKKLVINLGTPAVIFVTVGAHESKFIDTGLLSLILGAFFIVFSALFLLIKKLQVTPTTKNAIAISTSIMMTDKYHFMQVRSYLNWYGLLTLKFKIMSVLKVVEILGNSEESWEDAVQRVVNEVAKTVRNIRSVYIQDMQATIEDNRIAEYRVNAKVCFEVFEE